MVKKVALIGSGRRIQNNFIPALNCLPEKFEIVGIHSRTKEKFERVAEKFDLKPIYQVQDFPFSDIDMVVVSISISQVIVVVQKLLPYAQKLILLLDTPVLNRKRDIWAIKFLKKFKKVIVAEDYMNFPQFELLRNVCSAGVIGDVTNINLFHSGYRYHGLALIRSFLRFPYVRSIRTMALGTSEVITEFCFRDGVRACIVEPYLRERGSIIIIGSKGILTDFQYSKMPARPTYLLERLKEEGKIIGFQVRTPDKNYINKPRYLEHLESQDFEDKSLFNLLKTCGLIEIFKSINSENINTRYFYLEGLYDRMTSEAARKQTWLGCPLALLNSNYLNLMNLIL